MISYALLNKAIETHLKVILANENPSAVNTSTLAIQRLTALVEVMNKSIAYHHDASSGKWIDRIIFACSMFVGSFAGTLIARFWL